MRMREVFLCGLVLSGALIGIDASGGPPTLTAKPPQLQPQAPSTPAAAQVGMLVVIRPEVQREIAARLARLREQQKAKLVAESKAAAADAMKPSASPLTTIVQKRAADLKTLKDAAQTKSGPSELKMPAKESVLALFNDISIEDMVQLLFALISDDARQDMKELLGQMDSVRNERAALQAALKVLKEKQDEMKARMTELRIKQLTERELQLRKELEARRDLDAKAADAANRLSDNKSKPDAG